MSVVETDIYKKIYDWHFVEFKNTSKRDFRPGRISKSV
jgi:hypothetical protein